MYLYFHRSFCRSLQVRGLWEKQNISLASRYLRFEGIPILSWLRYSESPTSHCNFKENFNPLNNMKLFLLLLISFISFDLLNNMHPWRRRRNTRRWSTWSGLACHSLMNSVEDGNMISFASLQFSPGINIIYSPASNPVQSNNGKIFISRDFFRNIPHWVSPTSRIHVADIILVIFELSFAGARTKEPCTWASVEIQG